jgi:hypothetical protein
MKSLVLVAQGTPPFEAERFEMDIGFMVKLFCVFYKKKR